MKDWLISAVGVILVGAIAVIAREKMYIGTGWVMVGILFVFFGWFVATVFVRRSRRDRS
jgi:hypothetical protein